MDMENDISLDADAILSAVENGQDPSQLRNAPATVETPAPAAPTFERKFTHNGKEIVVNDADKYDTWARQGYDYSQKMSEFKSQQEKWDAERQQRDNEFKSSYNTYQEIDSFAKSNPDWWSHVQQSYQTRETPQIDPNLRQIIEPLQQELQGIKSFVNDYQAKQIEAQAAEQDKALVTEISDLAKRFPEVNFATKDANGQSLELAVIKHANERGIPSFSAAFYDYYQPHLEKLYEGRGRSAVEKDVQTRTKQGFLGTSQDPKVGVQKPVNLRSKSYGDLTQEALRELGLST
jgi:hypothetical protein